VRPVLEAPLPMSQIHEAYARMAGRRVMGKIVLVNP
jgi:D-arabinose 1-dehydrogenase-like Zn-dependent alcohol dehydrogenase